MFRHREKVHPILLKAKLAWGPVSTCTICLEEGGKHKLACGHKFHRHCIKRWFAENRSCPVCRAPQAPARRRLSFRVFGLIFYVFGLNR
jgi:hypothetical protein